MKKTENIGDGTKKGASKNSEMSRHNELKTDYPLSEKDEIKQAEEKMRRAIKKPL
jgi:hypothetical protein